MLTDPGASRQPPGTVCKICWTNIYQGEPTIWVTSPSPGIAHKACITGEKKN